MVPLDDKKPRQLAVTTKRKLTSRDNTSTDIACLRRGLDAQMGDGQMIRVSMIISLAKGYFLRTRARASRIAASAPGATQHQSCRLLSSSSMACWVGI